MKQGIYSVLITLILCGSIDLRAVAETSEQLDDIESFLENMGASHVYVSKAVREVLVNNEKSASFSHESRITFDKLLQNHAIFDKAEITTLMDEYSTLRHAQGRRDEIVEAYREALKNGDALIYVSTTRSDLRKKIERSSQQLAGNPIAVFDGERWIMPAAVTIDSSSNVAGVHVLGAQSVTIAATPTASNNAATKGYVDGLSLSGDVTGPLGNNVVSNIGGVKGTSAAVIAAAVAAINSATNNNTPNTLVKRDSNGNFSAGTISANLSGNASTASSATNFTGNLSGDVTGIQSNTTVATVGGTTASAIASSVVAINNATNNDTQNTLVKRDSNGNFSAGTISANISGNASTASSATNFTGNLSGDVTGMQSNTTIATVGGLSASAIATAIAQVQAATSAANGSTLVQRDSSGNCSVHILGAQSVSLGADPVNKLDAATKQYVDNQGSSVGTPANTANTLAMRDSNSAFSTTSININNLNTLAGETLLVVVPAPAGAPDQRSLYLGPNAGFTGTPKTGPAASGNTALGHQALSTFDSASAASYCTAVGTNALLHCIGNNNVAVGYNALPM